MGNGIQPADLRFFSVLAGAGSLGAAARELGITTPAVSKHLALMERRLGVPLVNRTTRRMGLTPEGELYLAHARRILGEIDDLEQLLGTSRGEQPVPVMVDALVEYGVNMLFTVGGDGTLRGAQAIAAEIARRKLPIAVVGIPKTIDNDIACVEKTFGFETAVAAAQEVVEGAHVEAIAARNGVGLVKLMGRDSGFIAAYTTLADSRVNFCLTPESPFTLEALLEALRVRLELRRHAVIAVAEGAGQELVAGARNRDASGNVLHQDIGLFLRDAIRAYFREIDVELNLKYIDPSYAIRNVPANAADSAFCLLLGHNAVHAAMAGRTSMVVGNWRGQFTHVPIRAAVAQRKKIDPDGWLWNAVLASTGQPHPLI